MGKEKKQTASAQQEAPKQDAPAKEAPKQEAPKEEKAAKTAAMTAAMKIAKGIFEASPAMKEVHVASDGTAFYTLNDAKNYARTLKNKSVISLKREDVK